MIELQGDAAPSQTHQQIVEAVLVAQAHGAALQLLLAALRRGIINAQYFSPIQINDREAFEQVVHLLDAESEGDFLTAEFCPPLEKTDPMFV
ncbi:MAG: hypothetical protein BWY63_02671 [Chloroflexi bacterium ADurb.Bin360]|nr:MAG: hypothetical protein BWY63_02671 [Chloroflexi bacterium ADurb.Bin360]